MVIFYDSVRELFRFLETDYEFKLISCDKDPENKLVYTNKTTGIKIVYEHSCMVYVIIYKLVNSKMVENPRPLKPDTPITCFDFNYLLAEKDRMKPPYEYGEDSIYYDEEFGLFNYVKEFADRLRIYGKDVLLGDFSMLPKIEEIIKSKK